MKDTMSSQSRIPDEHLLDHARATARAAEAHAPMAEKVGPDKLRRLANRSMMTMLHFEQYVSTPEQLVIYSDAYAEGYQQAHAARLAAHADATA